MTELILVAGAGGFIGGQLVRDLERQNFEVRAVDRKPVKDWYYQSSTAENLVLDLKVIEPCRISARGATQVYNFAADMGGMGFIEHNKALCMLSVLINTHLLMASQESGVKRYFFSSSACVYPDYRQSETSIQALREVDAYPAAAEDGYGWEKLFSERMCRHFAEDFGLITRVARYHNVYGPYGSWDGGREKAPAAICRKVAAALIAGSSTIEIWGDGKQTRSFMYIDDCLKGTQLSIAGVRLKRSFKLDAPTGVRGRNSDNTLIRETLGWEPSISLRTGMEETYRWIYDQVKARAEGRPFVAAL